MRSWLVAGTFWLVAIACILFAARTIPAAATTSYTFGVTWQVCSGCTYSAGCCCAPRDATPVTKTKIVVVGTKTVTKTSQGTRKAAARLRRRISDEPAVLDSAEPLVQDDSPDISIAETIESNLFKRHLCPRCPAGAKLVPAGRNGAQACCPNRKTITRTVKRTHTATKTVVAKLVQGTAYYDTDNNGVYNAAVDQLLVNTNIVLFAAPPASTGRVAAVAIYGKGTTDAKGHFKIWSSHPANAEIAIGKDSTANKPLATVKAGTKTSLDLNIPIARPQKPAVKSSPKPIAGVAKAAGSAVPGTTVKMLADSDTVGKTNVPSTGKFILSSGRIRSGRHVLRIVSSDARGADSLSVVIGTIEVPMPPTITSSGLEGNVEQVLGLAIPGATVSLYIDGVFAGSAIVKPDGSFEIKSAGLAVGVHTVAADQTTVNGTSDKATAPAVEVTVPPPAAPTVTRTSVSGKVATVVGKGAPGATLTLYANGIPVGTTTVNANGDYTVSSSALAYGAHKLEVAQVVGGLTSSYVAAGTATIPIAPPTVTTTSTAGKVATVEGKGEPGAVITLYSDGVSVAEVVVDANGSYTISSTELDFGTHNLEVSQTVNYGTKSALTSSKVAAGSATVILQAPVVTSTSTSGKQAIVVGKGEPFAQITLFADGVAVGKATADINGIFTVNSTDLSIGTHPLQVYQTVGAFTSPLVSAASVTIAANNSTNQVQTTAAPGTPRIGVTSTNTVPGPAPPPPPPGPPPAQTTTPAAAGTTPVVPAGATTTVQAPQSTTAVQTTTESRTKTNTITLTPSSTSETQTETSSTATDTQTSSSETATETQTSTSETTSSLTATTSETETSSTSVTTPKPYTTSSLTQTSSTRSLTQTSSTLSKTTSSISETSSTLSRTSSTSQTATTSVTRTTATIAVGAGNSVCSPYNTFSSGGSFGWNGLTVTEGTFYTQSSGNIVQVKFNGATATQIETKIIYTNDSIKAISSVAIREGGTTLYGMDTSMNLWAFDITSGTILRSCAVGCNGRASYQSSGSITVDNSDNVYYSCYKETSTNVWANYVVKVTAGSCTESTFATGSNKGSAGTVVWNLNRTALWFSTGSVNHLSNIRKYNSAGTSQGDITGPGNWPGETSNWGVIESLNVANIMATTAGGSLIVYAGSDSKSSTWSTTSSYTNFNPQQTLSNLVTDGAGNYLYTTSSNSIYGLQRFTITNNLPTQPPALVYSPMGDPIQIAADPFTGYIYISSSKGMYKYGTAAGVAIGLRMGLGGNGVAVHPSTGALYVGDATTVLIINNSTGATISTAVTGLADEARNLAFNSNGDLFVATLTKVYKIAGASGSAGTALATYSKPSDTSSTAFGYAIQSLAVSTAGDVYYSTVGFYADATACSATDLTHNVNAVIYKLTGGAGSPSTVVSQNGATTNFNYGLGYDANDYCSPFFTWPLTTMGNDLIVSSYLNNSDVARLTGGSTASPIRMDNRLSYALALTSLNDKLYVAKASAQVDDIRECTPV